MRSLSRADELQPGPGFAQPAEAERLCWDLLVRACRDRQLPWRLPMLATRSAADWPSLRTVVLRGVEPVDGRLHVHCDIRSAKIAEIRADSRVALGFWDAGRQLQLRLDGRAALEPDNGRLDADWARVPPASRRNYSSVDAPGAVFTEGALAGDGRANFALIRIEALRLEWLWLGEPEHLRGESRRGMDGWQRRRLQP